MIKGSTQEAIALVKIYTPNIGALRYIKQIQTKQISICQYLEGEIDKNTIRVGDFNTSLTLMNKSLRQKISKATEILHNTIEQLDLIDIFKTLQ